MSHSSFLHWFLLILSALSERERQQELALQRLEALKQKRANKIRGTKSGDGEGDSGKEVQEHSILENVLEGEFKIVMDTGSGVAAVGS